MSALQAFVVNIKQISFELNRQINIIFTSHVIEGVKSRDNTILENLEDTSANRELQGPNANLLQVPSQNKKNSKKKSQGTQSKPKQKRQRVLAFTDIEDPTVIEETNNYIRKIQNEIENEPLVPLEEWCNNKGITVTAMARLVKDADFPVIKVGDYMGAYKKHLHEAFEKEKQRQLRQQIQNRVCARILAQRQNEERNALEQKRLEPKQKEMELTLG